MSGAAEHMLGRDIAHLAVSRAIVLDWQDGPLAGFLVFDEDWSAWAFEVFAQRYEEDDLDDRLYLLREIPPRSFDELWGILERLESGVRHIIVPALDSVDGLERSRILDMVDRMVKGAGPSRLLMRASRLEVVEGLWEVVHEPS